ncbi:alkaline phosphatase [Enterovibrio norvegicus]|uniref:calcium-binding protein n=1 Tax=Enterovibrio norvegicus TaxID=188144 RepID=UPI000C8258A6|nr:calcium-binding protein [Enterovibrio norvegicus]MCC4799500.1 calcium-binding protein [Enterovibrio norvegicus]PMH64843.1 alkaline phosphatase [Enterovibrio norvegicus]PMI31572.1 alkaline phosphatase [Enterovibrio norvegicus]PMI36794.1 alkaline phosphatase [Enterovibrio norvegicus]PMN50213.1 alkaline phosphatase [Enterovibrio norvegicus]
MADINGTAVAETLYGTNESDNIFSFGGDDVKVGFGGDDNVFGGRGDDLMTGGAGNDFVSGGRGDDVVGGGSGNDILYGGLGNDYVLGGTGDDLLLAVSGNDKLFGGSGDDWLVSGIDNDFLIGGSGADTFLFDNILGNSTGDDRVVDFEVGIDTLFIRATGDTDFASLSISQVGINTLISLTDGSSFILNGITSTDLSASDFHIV